MKEESILKDLLNECKEDFLFFKDLGWRGYLFCAGILWTVIWIMAVDSESNTAFLLSILFVLLGIVVSGLSFLTLYLDAKKIDRRNGQKKL